MGDLAGLEAVVRDFRAAGLDAEAALGEAVVIGLAGEEQRAVRMLDVLLRDPVGVAVTVALGAAVARVAFLDRMGTADRASRRPARWSPTCSAGRHRNGCCGCSPSA